MDGTKTFHLASVPLNSIMGWKLNKIFRFSDQDLILMSHSQLQMGDNRGKSPFLPFSSNYGTLNSY